MKIKVKESKVLKPSEGSTKAIYLKMKVAVLRKIKGKIKLSKFLGVEQKGKSVSMPFLYTFSKATIGQKIPEYNAYTIRLPTGMNFFVFTYLQKKNMFRYSKKHGWMIRPYKKDAEQPKEYNHLTWENYVKDMFPRLTEAEQGSMYRGEVPDTVRARFIEQYTNGKGWCQVGRYPDQPGVSFVQCYDKDKNLVFWEDIPVILKIATIVKLKPRKKPVHLKRPKSWKIKPVKKPEKMTDKELYQYLYSRRKEYVKKVRNEPAGGWKLQFIDRDYFSEALNRKFIKKTKDGWLLIE